MRNIYIQLPSEALERLRELAQREFRDPKAQAAVLILDGLDREGQGVDVRASGSLRSAARTRRPTDTSKVEP
jgi:hypothetical protein